MEIANKKKPIRKGVYPGTFDPFTNGHLEVLTQAINFFDEILVLVAEKPNKDTFFSAKERLQLVSHSVNRSTWAEKIHIKLFSGLLVDYMKKHNFYACIRGVRQDSDLEYEYRMAWANRRLYDKFMPIFFIPREPYAFVSATLVKELASHNKPLNAFVPPIVEEAFRKKWNKT